MRELLFIATGGAFGALGRHSMNLLAEKILGAAFPFGTLLVNVLGCFLIGLLLEVNSPADRLSPLVLRALTVGFLGAFTTFSTFGFETFDFLESKSFALALGNVLANVFLGLFAVWAGVSLGRSFMEISG